MYAAGFAVAIAEKFDLTVRTKNNTKLMKSIFYLQKSMMVHFPASYNSNSYLGDYSYSYKW